MTLTADTFPTKQHARHEVSYKVFNLLKVSLLKIYWWLAYHPAAQQKGDLQCVRQMHQAPRCHLDHPMKYPPHWTLVNGAFQLHKLQSYLHMPCFFIIYVVFFHIKILIFFGNLELSSSFYRLNNLQAVQGKPPKAVTGLVGAVGQIHLI